MAIAMFTHWGRSARDGRLDLWIERSSGNILEAVQLDIRELSQRTELLDRIPLRMKQRLLRESLAIRRGHLTVSGLPRTAS